MDIFFILCAAVCFTAAIILLIIRKSKRSTLTGNAAFVMIIISLLSIGCYSLNVDTLFKTEYSHEFSQPATSSSTADCQASATQLLKKISAGVCQPRHFLGLLLSKSTTKSTSS